MVAPLSLLLALIANLSNLFNIAGVFTGPLALAFAAFAIWRGRRWVRLTAVVAALLAIAAFAIGLALIYGLSHGCADAPGCSD
jgi:hypothetical protein